MRTLAASFLVHLALVVPCVIRAQWQPNGTALSTASNDQIIPTIVADGAGGAIVTWQDRRSGNLDLYAQRVNASGVVQWMADGDTLCSAAGNQQNATSVSDGSGGAIVTWDDARSGNLDIYAQRVNASGVVQWALDGVALCAAAGNQYYPAIVSDGAGGAIVTWYDGRPGSNSLDIYAQWVDASGAPQWAADGIALCTALGFQYYPAIASDGAGGAIVAWQDDRAAPAASDIYARRVTAAGAVQWVGNGLALCTDTDEQSYPVIVSDGAGGAIVAWKDYRADGPSVYAQRVDALGAVQWAGNGVALGTTTGEPYEPRIISNGAGGAIVTWHAAVLDTTYIYAQLVDNSGAVQWTASGSTLCAAGGSRMYPTITSDGAGGAIVPWFDSRSGCCIEWNIYAQRVNASGTVQWLPNGDSLCTAAGDQAYPVIVSDGAGGAIVAWEDARDGDFDIYALRVGPGGVPTAVGAAPAAALALRPNYPNPFSTSTTIDLNLPADADVKVDVFDVAGRKVRQLDLGRIRAGSKPMRFDGLDDKGRVLPSGVYFCRVRAGAQTLTRKMVIAR